MKKITKITALLLALALVFCACGKKEEETNSSGSGDESDRAGVYSQYLEDNGRFKGLTALDHVVPCDIDNLVIKASEVEPTDEEIQAEIDKVLSYYTTREYVYDREVADGDTVNIDYVGTIDGVEFSGGSTGGNGTDVIIGVTSYIDDFLQQLIGHKPGETVKVEVTFPDDYGNADLNGKDAVFETKINYIVLTIMPELTDDFVKENLAEDYNVSTAADFRRYYYDTLKQEKVEDALPDLIIENSTIKDLPDAVYEYEKGAFIDYYTSYAEQYGMSLDDFLAAYSPYNNADELVEEFKDSIVRSANFVLVMQAISEKYNILADEEDVKNFFESEGLPDYTEYEEYFGKPYISMMVTQVMIEDRIEENLKFE